MFSYPVSSKLARRALALTFVFGAAVAMNAQSGPNTSNDATSGAVKAMPTPLPAVTLTNDQMFSSSRADTDAATPGAVAAGADEVATLHPTVNFAELMQYGGGQRRRRGNPRYRGGNTNADGSSKYTFFAGAGLSQPIGNTFHYLTPSYGFQFGGGRNFNKSFGLMLQFDYDHMGFAGATLANQTVIYNSPNVFGAGAISGLDGSSHTWSFTLDPTYTLFSGDGLGAYLVAGAGFYHKTANFTVPSTGEYFDVYCGCYIQYSANESIDKYTANAPGFSGGFGLTYKFSRFSNERFYAEARYVFVDNSHKPGFTVNNTAAITATSTNLYPANSNRTTYIPIKVGLRF